MDSCILAVLTGVLSIVCLTEAGGSYNYTLEQTLRAQLLDSAVYDPVTRPEDVVHVSVSFHLLSIEKLDISYQQMTSSGHFQFDIGTQQMIVHGFLAVEWYDRRLSWNKTEQDNMEYIFAKQSEIWYPELINDNSVSGFDVINDRYLQLRIKHDGSSEDVVGECKYNTMPPGLIFWEPPLLFETHCEVDITYYPFDQQKCGVDIASWGYHEDEVTLEHHYDYILMEDYNENGEWIVTGTNTEFHHLADTVDGVTHFFPQLDFNVFIRRRPAYYILNRILPVVLSSFLVVVVFILPSESGEKVSYALTELLALAFLLTLITDYMPSTSITISVLGLYLAFTLFLSTFATLATVVILYFFHKDGDMENNTCLGKFTQFLAITVRWGKNKKTTKIRRIMTPDVGDGKDHEHFEEEEVYSWREVSEICNKACLWLFLFMTSISTLVFMTLLAAGGKIQGVR